MRVSARARAAGLLPPRAPRAPSSAWRAAGLSASESRGMMMAAADAADDAAALRLPWAPGAARGAWSLRDKLLAPAPGPNAGGLPEGRLEALADLVNLGLPEDAAQRDKLKEDLEAVLRFGELVTEAKAALRPGSDDLAAARPEIGIEPAPLREDEVTEGDIKEAILANAARSEDGHFVVYQKRP